MTLVETPLRTERGVPSLSNLRVASRSRSEGITSPSSDQRSCCVVVPPSVSAPSNGAVWNAGWTRCSTNSRTHAVGGEDLSARSHTWASSRDATARGAGMTVLGVVGAVIADTGFQASGDVTPRTTPHQRPIFRRERGRTDRLSTLGGLVARAVAHPKSSKILFSNGVRATGRRTCRARGSGTPRRACRRSAPPAARNVNGPARSKKGA